MTRPRRDCRRGGDLCSFAHTGGRMRTVRTIGAAVLVLACATFPASAQTQAPARAAAAAKDTLRVSGLDQPVEVIRDRWGINHIYAKTEHDMFFVQGYSAVKDRLFQFEIWRRQATGTVAEILGRAELKRDLGIRLCTFRGDLKAELNWYHPRGEAIVTAFVDGVNAYIDEALRSPDTLPMEFKMLGIRPGKWTTAAVISRFNPPSSSLPQEVNTARAVRVLGADKVKDLSKYYGRDPDLEVDPATDLSLINQNVIELYTAYRTALRFTPDQIVAEYRGEGSVGQLASAIEEPDPLALIQQTEDIGSNNWVVSGKLTRSGKPVIMNDPHRVQGAPSLRYWTHLVGPGWNVIGAGEPVLPGISIGHNEYGAWGVTSSAIDAEDLYVYKTNPANPNQYQYNGAWEDMRIIKDTIPVKGEAPVAVDLKYTRHGPVLYEDKEHHVAYGFRAAWLEVGNAPYLASLRMNQATTWQEFRDACAYARFPPLNMIWGDVHGDIGYQLVGIAPMRRTYSGLVPVPGDGRYEWEGFLPIKALPNAENPEKGFWATANHYLFPPDYPYPEAQSFTGTDPFRIAAVTEFLSSGRLFTVADMAWMQNYVLSIPARQIVPLLRDVTIADATAGKARDLLLSWNHILDKDSVAAGIYEMFQRRLLANMRDLVVPSEAREVFGSVSMVKVIDWLYAPDGRFGEQPVAGRDKILTSSLDQAIAELTTKLGPDMSRWQYGQEKYHHATIVHPLSGAVKPEVRSQLEVGPAPRGGDGYTIDATGGADNQTSGGSFKMISNTDDWDTSLGINNPGQSGDPTSPHYRDLFELWSRGKYFPIFFSRPRVESVAERTFVLQPVTPAPIPKLR